MKIATWNVNSIKARRERALAWLETQQPDVLCLQETKLQDDKFPHEDFHELGYRSVHHGQKTYNGVAILAKAEPEDVRTTLDDDVDDPQARLISARVRGIRVISVYVPNGQHIESEKYPYKLKWYARLRAYLERHHDPGEPLVLCGDFNVAPEARDCYDPAGWADTVLCHSDARGALQNVLDWGLSDTFRKHVEDEGKYSWWDYRQLAFPKKRGLRIDMVFATQPVLDACTGASIDRDARKGKQPSDHAPVIAELDWPQ